MATQGVQKGKVTRPPSSGGVGRRTLLTPSTKPVGVTKPAPTHATLGPLSQPSVRSQTQTTGPSRTTRPPQASVSSPSTRTTAKPTGTGSVGGKGMAEAAKSGDAMPRSVRSPASLLAGSRVSRPVPVGAMSVGNRTRPESPSHGVFPSRKTVGPVGSGSVSSRAKLPNKKYPKRPLTVSSL